MIQTDELTQGIFREHMRKHLAIIGVDSSIELWRLVEHLLNHPEINRLNGEEQKLTIVRKLSTYYILAEQFRSMIDKLEENDQKYQKKKKMYVDELKKIALQMPIAESTLIELFVKLTKGTDLMNIRPSSASDDAERRRRMRF